MVERLSTLISMTVENIDLWVSATGFGSPYYRFYTDSDGNQELSELTFDTSKTYAFYRLNEETRHPFFISDTGYKQTSSDAILITGDGSPSNGITGGQSFKVQFTGSSGDIEDLLYYCSSHELMQGDINLNHNSNLLPAPSTPNLSSASDTGSSEADNLTSDVTPTFTGTTEAGNSVELFVDGVSLGTTATDESGNWSFTLEELDALTDGSYAITATATTSSTTLQSTPISPAYPGRTNQEVRNEWAFAALKEDGSVVAWGDTQYGGDISSVSADLQSGVTQLFSAGLAFAALKQDGSVITWGHSSWGGDSSSVSADLQSGVTQLFSTRYAFAAVKEDGSVVAWGDTQYGGDSSNVSTDLQSGVTQIFSLTMPLR